MEIFELGEKKKAFAPPQERYKNPLKEAIKLRELWSYYKPVKKRQEMQEAKRLFREASNLMKEEGKLKTACRLVNKGLFYNPSFHALYALKGDIQLLQGNWRKAVISYENAKLIARFDHRVSKQEIKNIYNKQLMEAYTKRGDWNSKNNLLIEALADYEQVFLYKLSGIDITEVQDKLLDIIRKLNKYSMFQIYWNKFMKTPDSLRISDLLAIHAEFKINLREMGIARHMLLKALNLNEDHKKAKELLQIVFSTGQTLARHSVIWCMHNCYDKALIIVEKALDCDPYNPGFNLLKTIVLRLSGRFEEANSWLQSLSNNFYKLMEPTKDKEKSVMEKISINEARDHLIKQWYLIRYDMAMQCMLEDKLDAAVRIVYKSNLVKHYTEPYILLGDYFLKNKETDRALKSYLKCREKMHELQQPVSRKTIDLTERIINILNNEAEIAMNKERTKQAVDIATQALCILDEDKIPLHELRLQRGRALLLKAHGLFQIENKRKIQKKKQSCETAADGLRFVRELNEDLYQILYRDRNIEVVIDRFAPTRELPRSLKILMQFS